MRQFMRMAQFRMSMVFQLLTHKHVALFALKDENELYGTMDYSLKTTMSENEHNIATFMTMLQDSYGQMWEIVQNHRGMQNTLMEAMNILNEKE